MPKNECFQYLSSENLTSPIQCLLLPFSFRHGANTLPKFGVICKYAQHVHGWVQIIDTIQEQYRPQNTVLRYSREDLLPGRVPAIRDFSEECGQTAILQSMPELHLLSHGPGASSATFFWAPCQKLFQNRETSHHRASPHLHTALVTYSKNSSRFVQQDLLFIKSINWCHFPPLLAVIGLGCPAKPVSIRNNRKWNRN